jgi:chemotaxis methyl-accepting protein methylase
MSYLRSYTRHDFTHYKRATVLRRIERRLQVNRLTDLPSYRDFLRDHPEEGPLLLQDMLISVTNFFRDRDAFEALEREAIPRIVESKQPGDQVRVWVAGCATGEEAYSLSMLLRERRPAVQAAGPSLQIFATDIDERAIATARKGTYAQAVVEDVTPSRLRQFFVKDQDQYRVSTVVREPVLFALHNLLRDPPFSRLDLICCRNLLIYLDRSAQAHACWRCSASPCVPAATCSWERPNRPMRREPCSPRPTRRTASSASMRRCNAGATCHWRAPARCPRARRSSRATPLRASAAVRRWPTSMHAPSSRRRRPACWSTTG